MALLQRIASALASGWRSGAIERLLGGLRPPDDAARGGSTSGEMLMNVRWILSELNASPEAPPRDVLEVADQVIESINRLGI